MNSSVIYTGRVRHVIAALIAWLQSPAASAAVAGCVSAVSLFAWLARVSAVAGPSQFAQCGLILAAAIGLAWGSLRSNRNSATGLASAGWWLLAVTGWSVVLPLLLAGPQWLVAHSSWSLLESPAIALLLGLAIGLVVLTLPTFAITRLLESLERWSDSWKQSGRSSGGDARSWFAAGWLVCSLVGTPLASAIGGLDLLGALAVPVGCLSAGWTIYRAHFEKQIVSLEFGNTSPADRSTIGTLLSLMAAAVIGVAFVAIERMLFELTPAAYYLSAMAWTSLVCGRLLAFPKFFRQCFPLAILFRRPIGEFRWVNDRAVASRLGGTLLLAALLLTFTAGWSGLIALGLTTNAFVSQVVWICTLRMMAVGVVCGTLGRAWRQLAARPADSHCCDANFPAADHRADCSAGDRSLRRAGDCRRDDFLAWGGPHCDWRETIGCPRVANACWLGVGLRGCYCRMQWTVVVPSRCFQPTAVLDDCIHGETSWRRAVAASLP